MTVEFIPLRDSEIQDFWNELDLDKDGHLTTDELAKKLQAVLKELAPNPQRHHLHHPDRSKHRLGQPLDAEKQDDERGNEEAKTASDLQAFVRALLPGSQPSMIKDEFCERVKAWDIPSQDQTSLQDTVDAQEYYKSLSWTRRLRAWWSVRGPEVAFIAFVVALQIAFGLWQFILYLKKPQTRAALGAGVVVAKLAAGALYPTFFFLILSMSRWFATFCRRSYTLSRFINWDLSQAFHIRISIAALCLSCLHAIGHLTGTFLYGSRPSQQEDLAVILGTAAVPMTYADFVSLRPGWSGLTALISFLIIAVTSLLWMRKRYYEVFQLAHCLMYVMFAMLALHGTARLLQAPMLGYWLAFPVVLVLIERVTRLTRGFLPRKARLEALDDGTVVITAEKPEGQRWRAQAGQYVFVQVPSISFFQWHPFTISACVGNRLQVHIKADGNWTKKLHKLAMEGKNDNDTEHDYVQIRVGIDGGYGSPSQRFYDFEKSLIIGAGIGITPFSAILTDLEERYKAKGDPWKLTRTRSFNKLNRVRSRNTSSGNSPSLSRTSTQDWTRVNSEDLSHRVGGGATPRSTPPVINESMNNVPGFKAAHLSKNLRAIRYNKPGERDVRRVDFHWSVREKNDLLWFSSLLNRAAELAGCDPPPPITLNIHSHVTATRKNISTHIFRYLLDLYRTEDFPYSSLTGLRAASSFGRPDYPKIMAEFYEDLAAQGWRGKVGVFYCGPSVIGEVLSDQSRVLTARSRDEGTGIRFVVMTEVFG